MQAPWGAALQAEVPREGVLLTCLPLGVHLHVLLVRDHEGSREEAGVIAVPSVLMCGSSLGHPLCATCRASPSAGTSNGWFSPCVAHKGQEMVQMSLSARPPRGSAEPVRPAALALPGPFFLYSSALSQGPRRCGRHRVCLASQHLPASRSLPTRLPPTPGWWQGACGGGHGSPWGGGNPRRAAGQPQRCRPRGSEDGV